jgi:hypothetical protein
MGRVIEKAGSKPRQVVLAMRAFGDEIRTPWAALIRSPFRGRQIAVLAGPDGDIFRAIGAVEAAAKIPPVD